MQGKEKSGKMKKKEESEISKIQRGNDSEGVTEVM